VFAVAKKICANPSNLRHLVLNDAQTQVSPTKKVHQKTSCVSAKLTKSWSMAVSNQKILSTFAAFFELRICEFAI
jgi:5-keto 4-deoxyuronate isomerase